jgi:hypothetical protein
MNVWIKRSEMEDIRLSGKKAKKWISDEYYEIVWKRMRFVQYSEQWLRFCNTVIDKYSGPCRHEIP